MGDCRTIPLQPSHLFQRMTDFQALHPKIKGLFDGFYKNLGEKIHFGKKLCVYALLYDVQTFQKSLLRYAGGYSEQVRQQRGQFLFTVSNAAVLVQKNRHSRRTQITAFLEGANVKGYIYTPNPFECRCGRSESV